VAGAAGQVQRAAFRWKRSPSVERRALRATDTFPARRTCSVLERSGKRVGVGGSGSGREWRVGVGVWLAGGGGYLYITHSSAQCLVGAWYCVRWALCAV
jgi:hypothetical protein